MGPLALSLLLAATTLAAPSSGEDPLAPARALLAAGDFLSVLDAVDKAKGAPAADAAEVLDRAGQLAFDQGDRWMASRYCARALEKVPKEKSALRLCLRAALVDERFEDADRYGETLARLSPADDGSVALLRAKAALGQGLPPRAKTILAPHVAGPRKDEVRALLAQADALTLQLKEEEAQRKLLNARLAKAMANVDARKAAAARDRRETVVLYTTAWCGVCKKAKAWLRQQRIAHIEKDIEADPDANLELLRKCAHAGIRPNGVPVLDARGRLVVGFAAASYQAALR